MSEPGMPRGREAASGGDLLRGLKKAPKSSVVTDLTTDPPSPTPGRDYSGDGQFGNIRREPTEEPRQPEPRQEPAPPAPQPEPEPAPAPPAPKPKPEKITYYQDAASKARLRSAFVSTQVQTGYRSLSEFIASAVEKECARLEAAYNDGEQFGAGADLVKRGRPFRD